jgi:hypothetical protein
MQAIIKILKDNPELLKKIGLFSAGLGAGGAAGKAIDLASDELSGRNSFQRSALRTLDKATKGIDLNSILERLAGR